MTMILAEILGYFLLFLLVIWALWGLWLIIILSHDESYIAMGWGKAPAVLLTAALILIVGPLLWVVEFLLSPVRRLLRREES